MGRLHELFSACGQSPWLDNLRRGWITDGQLAALRDRGVRGLTSNPTIFQKAIQGSADYDSQFAQLVQQRVEPIDAYWRMVLSDIDAALDVFEPVFVESGGSDGFVSVEVDPSLAHDTAATLSTARDLHQRIGRPNVMIKIPATKEGLPAIRTMIAEGRSVNVTLIFSLERYRALRVSSSLVLIPRSIADLRASARLMLSLSADTLPSPKHGWHTQCSESNTTMRDSPDSPPTERVCNAHCGHRRRRRTPRTATRCMWMS
jgi:transaldolase